MSERLTEAADAIYLDACVRLLHAAQEQDQDQEQATDLHAFTETLERMYPGVGDRVRKKNGLPPKP